MIITSMNRIFAFLILAGIILTVGLGVASNHSLQDGGMYSFMTGFITVGLVIAWPFAAIIDHRASKGPAKPMTASDLERFRRNRILVIIALILFIVLPFIFGG